MSWRFACVFVVLAACSPPAPTEKVEAPPAAVAATALDVATVAAPLANARVTSPLQVSGLAPANWFFENQFPVRLVNAQGADIAQAPATPRVNWTEPGDKEFDATLTFTVTRDTPATLVLQEDMPGDGETPREVRVVVVLAGAN